MEHFIYQGSSWWVFFFITLILGGSGAWQTGKAVAKSWQSIVILVPYMLLLSMAVRFIHFALFEEVLLSFSHYFFDFIVLFVLSYMSWNHQRMQMMILQYAFIFESSSPFSWHRRQVDKN